MIPALTLWQPWASLIFTETEVKRHETRSFRLPDRLVGEKVAIHSAARSMPWDLGIDDVSKRHYLAGLCEDIWGPHWRSILPRGYVLGAVRFGKAIPAEEATPGDRDRMAGDFSPGRWAWPIVEVEVLRAPLQAKGRQGWWKVEYPEFVL